MLNVLIVEDEIPVRMLTRARLKNAYHILEAGNGAEALAVMEQEHIDLMIVDIMMPEMDGYEFVKILRDAGDMTPVIMLTAMSDFSHKKKGFATGIDDYLTKPINYEELQWHIEAILRRANISNAKQITVGHTCIKSDTLSITVNGETIELTEKESALIYKLLSYPNTVFSKQQLMDEIWGYDTESDYNTIKTYVSRIRNKLKNCTDFEIVSVRGLGYKAIVHSEVKK